MLLEGCTVQEEKRSSVFCCCYFWSENRFSCISVSLWFVGTQLREESGLTYFLLSESKLKKKSTLCHSVCFYWDSVCTRYELRLLRMFTPPARNSIRPWCIISARSTPCNTRRRWLCWSPYWATCRPRCAHTQTHRHWLNHTHFHLRRNGR